MKMKRIYKVMNQAFQSKYPNGMLAPERNKIENKILYYYQKNFFKRDDLDTLAIEAVRKYL